MSRALLALACTVACLPPSLAIAQAPADDPEARALFERGRLALEEGRPAEAREPLERSFLLRPQPATAFNLIVAYWGSGQPVSATMLCDRLLADAFGPVDPERRPQAEEVCASARADVAHLDIVVAGAPRAEVRLDGESIGESDEGTATSRDVDPGRHVLTARAPGRVADEHTVQIGRGETATVRLRLVPTATEESAGGIGWGWWLAGGIGVAVIAAVIIAIAATSTHTNDPIGGDFPITATLSL